MPQKIITLPKQLANQIAAGEVVERPVSVVKELVENSIDAGATRIEIYLEEGGKKLIEIRDNGGGIAPEDIEKSIEKYSTSKITSLEDLHNVMTFGFRGEALASISSVSEFTLSSKIPDALGGIRLTLDQSEQKSISERAMDAGTIIEVKNLFYNTPARLNYLKTDRTEYAKTLDYVQKIALAYPKISFELFHEGKNTQSFGNNEQLRDRIYKIYGAEFHDSMISVQHEFSGVKLSGYITDPKISFHNRTRQSLFVNKRSITSPMISKAIFDAYNRFIAPKTFPGYVLFLDMDPTRVDANVHPRKLEVRFADEQNVYRSLYHGVKNELERVSLASPSLTQSSFQSSPHTIPHPGSLSSQEREAESTPKYHTSSGTKFKNYSPYTDTTPNPAQSGLDFNKAISGENAARSLSSQDKGETERSDNFEVEAWQRVGGKRLETSDIRETPLGRIVGQVHNAYIVVETSEGIQILDQHAVAERVIFEKISKNGYIPKIQQLLGGIGMSLTTGEQEIVEEHGEVFENLGFEIDMLSHGNILLRTIPDFMRKTDIEKVFLNILSDISSVGSKSLEEVRNKIWAYTACRSAIKFGDPLTVFEMNALLRDASVEYSATCPHGRPVIYDVSLEELKGKYER